MPKLGMEPIRKKQVIEAVLKCVAQDGIENVTLEKTAKHAGVSKGVVVYYFQSKENLLFQSFQSFFLSFLELPKDGSTLVGDSYSSKDLLLLIGKSVLGIVPQEKGFTEEESKKILMQIFSRLTISQDYKEMVRGVYQEYLKQVKTVLSHGMESKELQIENPQSTGIQLLALLDGLILFSVMGFQGSIEDQYERYKEFIERL